jgi:hypothetical protein
MPAVELSSGMIDYEDTGGELPVIVLLPGGSGRSGSARSGAISGSTC